MQHTERPGPHRTAAIGKDGAANSAAHLLVAQCVAVGVRDLGADVDEQVADEIERRADGYCTRDRSQSQRGDDGAVLGPEFRSPASRIEGIAAIALEAAVLRGRTGRQA